VAVVEEEEEGGGGVAAAAVGDGADSCEDRKPDLMGALL
jgi:hypothetical protein